MVRFPAGLTFSMLVAAISIAALTVFGGLGLAGSRTPPPLVHTSAALCLLWSLGAFLVSRRNQADARHGDLLSVLQVGSMATGLLAILIMVYAAVVEVLLRTVYLDYVFTWQVLIWPSGVIDVGIIAAATLLHWYRTRQHQLMTVLLWLIVLASLWASFRVRGGALIGTIEQNVPSAWASGLMLGCALGVTVLTIVAGWLERRRRIQAWPDRLSELTLPEANWPGFRYSAGLLGVVVLCLGCIHVVVPWTVPAAFLTGGSLLALAHRRWNENLADAALALLTLGVIAVCMIGMDWPVWTAAGYAWLFNRALFGLAIMTGFWHWLGLVWHQQLDEGRPWTTAGRLIHVTRRVGFLTACAGVLISIHLAFWPNVPYVVDPDDSTARWVLGLAANALLILLLVFSTRRTQKPTLAWLTVFAFMSTCAFVLVRVPTSTVGRWWSLHWPLVLVVAGAAALVLALLLARRPGARAFLEPLLITGLLIAPAGALTGIALSDVLRMPLWVPFGTFTCLAGVYLLASFAPGPLVFRALAILCAVVGLAHLRLLSSSAVLESGYFHLALAGLAIALTAMVYRRHPQQHLVRVGMTVGSLLAVAGMILAVVSS